MQDKLHIIYVPGLNDHKKIHRLWIRFISWFWSKYGSVQIFYPEWEKGNGKEKITAIEKIIDTYSGKKVILVGQSAGGSVVINAFTSSKNSITAVINVGGRVKEGKSVFPSLALAAKGNKAFKDSVQLCERVSLPSLTLKDKKQIFILKPLWDEVVPSSTCSIASVQTIRMPIVTHALGGALAGIVYVPRLFQLLGSKDFHL